MEGLLHSKKFRTNLYRWLFMYVGVLLLLTTVITYSKYMSKSVSNQDARAAKFIIDIKEGECSGCNLTSYRPTSKIEKELVLDFTNLEVTTEVELTLSLDPDFSYEILEEKTNTSLLETCQSQNDDEKVKTLCGRIPANFNSIIKYKVVVNYTKDTYQFTTPKDQKYNIINVGWSASQLT